MDQPMFTTRAHVYQIDPETKKDWLQSSVNVVPVNFYRDNARNSYRIISFHEKKAIVNSTVTSNMLFTKTSQKFGQWSDFRADTVYGLGFDSESDMKEFMQEFQKIVKLSNKTNSTNTPSISSASSTTPSNSSTTPNSASNTTTTTTIATAASTNDSKEPKVASKPSSAAISSVTPPISTTTAGKSIHQNGSTTLNEQLKYENDRLKIALAQSSTNAKKWDVELQTLKNNNARLTTALQESNTNVNEWKSQLSRYKSQEDSGPSIEDSRREIAQLQESLTAKEASNRVLADKLAEKQEEIRTLLLSIEELKPYELENTILYEKVERLKSTHDDKMNNMKKVLAKHLKELQLSYNDLD